MIGKYCFKWLSPYKMKNSNVENNNGDWVVRALALKLQFVIIFLPTKHYKIIKNCFTFFCVSQIKLEFGSVRFWREGKTDITGEGLALRVEKRTWTTYSSSHTSMLGFQPGPHSNWPYMQIGPCVQLKSGKISFYFHEALLSWNRDNG